jgi:hypothetical protein
MWCRKNVDLFHEKLGGCYLTLDTVREEQICSGFAEHGPGRRLKEHLRASHLADRNTRDGPQHQLYPHESFGDDEAPTEGALCPSFSKKLQCK